MPTSLIVLVILLVLVAAVVIFAIVYFGPTKDVRRREVKAARASYHRADAALTDVRNILFDTPGLDLVGDDMRRRALDRINHYEQEERKLRGL